MENVLWYLLFLHYVLLILILGPVIIMAIFTPEKFRAAYELKRQEALDAGNQKDVEEYDEMYESMKKLGNWRKGK